MRRVIRREHSAVATDEIVDEYQATVNYLLDKYGGKRLQLSIVPILTAMEIIPATSKEETEP